MLQKLPNLTTIPPAPFKVGGRAQLDKTLNRVRNSFNNEVLEDWLKFAATAPINDNVEDYINANPDAYHIPFFDILFTNPIAGPGIRPSFPSNRRTGE